MGKKQRTRGGGVANSNLPHILTESNNHTSVKDLLRDDGEYLVSSQADDFDDQYGQERRFLWITTAGVGNRRSDFEDTCSSSNNNNMSMSDKGLAKHQVNYSATKYIKP